MIIGDRIATLDLQKLAGATVSSIAVIREVKI
jgi:hypothetical protein